MLQFPCQQAGLFVEFTSGVANPGDQRSGQRVQTNIKNLTAGPFESISRRHEKPPRGDNAEPNSEKSNDKTANQRDKQNGRIIGREQQCDGPFQGPTDQGRQGNAQRGKAGSERELFRYLRELASE